MADPISGRDDKLVRDQPIETPPEQGPLAAYKGAAPPAPKWFLDAVATRYETGFVSCEGARIHFQRWGDRAKPGLLLVHGNGAHAHWWDFVAPYLVEDYNVVAMTFSGMGDSDWRESYTMDVFAREQLAVAEAAGLFDHAEKPIIVSHSFGGFVSVLTGAEHGDRFEGSVIVDSPINPPDRARTGPPAVRGGKIYPTLEAALARFRLAPVQPCENHYILDYIARWSLRETPLPDGGAQGWSWKFDPSIWRHFTVSRPPQELLRETRCRIALFKGDRSVIWDDDVGDYMRGLLNRQVPLIAIPEAGHHVMLDQPLAFVAALRTLLQEWRHSSSTRVVTNR
ncbi:MAG: alpha/beta hydrolase [Alphaproteobacteria bacterium]|nr:alpha/beta hydrolase [Alphaproteobacteria bacterium]